MDQQVFPQEVVLNLAKSHSPENSETSGASGAPSNNTTTVKTEADNTTKSKEEVGSKKSKRRKKKVEMACVYCRRSHMICDDSRPCLRCIKRGIGHLCHDEPTPGRKKKTPDDMADKGIAAVESGAESGGGGEGGASGAGGAGGASGGGGASGAKAPVNAPPPQPPQQPQAFPPPQQPILDTSQRNNATGSTLAKTLPFNEEPFFYSEHAGSEFSLLNDFLSMIDDPDLVHGSLGNGGSGDTLMPFLMPQEQQMGNLLPFSPVVPYQEQAQSQNQAQNQQSQNQSQNQQQSQQNQQSQNQQNAPKTVELFFQEKPVISDSARDKFFLTAADPTIEISPEERLKQVIKAKLEAGLLQPYNYAKGYARLQSYMDNYMNQSSRQRILKPLSIFRPAFRAIAKTLKDVDLVLVEESFERMLLDYDRVFTSMAIPACLWRRTGEIYRGNKEFASLVGVTTDDLKDGKLAIYELMSEESAVNFWEKYGAIAFDKGQKAVLTSCNLRTKDGYKRKSCCFSFTIRRDRYNIPSCIVGNFIPIEP